MNLLNRMIAILALVAVACVAVVVVLVALGARTPLAVLPPPWHLLLEPFAILTHAARTWVVVAGIVAVPLCLYLLVLEVRPRRPEPALLVQAAPEGSVTVSRRGVQHLADVEGGRVAGVVAVRSKVRETPQGLCVRGRVVVRRSAPLPEVARQVQERIRSGIERTLGRAVAEVRLQTQFESTSPQRSHGRSVR